MKNNMIDASAPSLQGGMGRAPIDWSKLLKILIAVLTALAGTIGVASCTKEKAPSTPPEGEPTTIAANIMPRHDEHTLISREA